MPDRIFSSSDNFGRRGFLRALASGATLALAGYSPALSGAEVVDVSPGEDLMREHGVLKRILLVYGEAVRRLEAKEELPPEALTNSAGIIRSFIEDYHEKLEENFLFPRFRKANRLVDLVEVLKAQHEAGRRLTDVTMQLATRKALEDAKSRSRLADSLRLFIRMYNPHHAREDTVLFPALGGILTADEHSKLGDDFERRENELFGDSGFEKTVDRVAAIEESLGLYDLKQFTPTFGPQPG